MLMICRLLMSVIFWLADAIPASLFSRFSISKRSSPIVARTEPPNDPHNLAGGKGEKGMRSFPMQPIVKDEHDVARFQKNRIVYDLWKEGKVDLNTIGIRAADGEYTEAAQVQFAQLIG